MRSPMRYTAMQGQGGRAPALPAAPGFASMLLINAPFFSHSRPRRSTLAAIPKLKQPRCFPRMFRTATNTMTKTENGKLLLCRHSGVLPRHTMQTRSALEIPLVWSISTVLVAENKFKATSPPLGRFKLSAMSARLARSLGDG